ncbi:DNA polymerase III subunit delta [uncultured Paludibaculum sp.]|uniref:DNA polymerase III subunit delta n=1 Tax=uncultured Paludibaculum sp. TaxID=1765020 RepID=UPI002AAC49CA|nr:DNA polymerase III subunit delta [uncultured Paludibaculum sp.]
MTPDQFLRSLSKQDPEPVYLFVGPEGYRRAPCRKALIEKMLSVEDREEGYTRHDLDEVSLNEVLDDARSMSLFARNRVIWVASAESALPRGRAAASEEEESSGKAAVGPEALTSYCQDPTPGVVLVFDARKWDFDGEDKTKMDRLAKYYGAIRAVVEFVKFTPQDARAFVQSLAGERGLRLGSNEIDLLVEATAADASRLANEVEKLALFAEVNGGKVTAADIANMVPNAQETTVFNLVNALARRSRVEAMQLLDTLVREGEYLPLALTFLGGIFRLALAAREQGLRSSSEVQSFFQRQGTPMWRSRADQIHTASSKFTKEKLEEALQLVFRADRDMKSSRVDDRIVMEDFVLRLTR